MTARTIWVLLLLQPGQVKVFVDERVGRLEGQVDLGTEMLALARIVSRVDGVVNVDHTVSYRWTTTRDAAWPYGLQVG